MKLLVRCTTVIALLGVMGLSMFHSNVPVQASPMLAQSNAADIPLDDFGYVGSFAASNWLEAPDAQDAQLFQPTPIGFSFKFYDKVFTSVNIELSTGSSTIAGMSFKQDNQGAVSFIKVDFIRGDTFDGQATYKTGGIAPNRYFLVQWLDAKTSGCSRGCVVISHFDAQIILQESGNILIHYRNLDPVTTPYVPPYLFSVEMQDWTGFENGFVQVPPLAAGLASLEIIRPPSLARSVGRPAFQSQLTSLNATNVFTWSVQNQGDFGSDTFDIQLNTAWPISIFDVTSLTPLVDTNGNGVIDTGPIAQGTLVTYTAYMTTPAVVGSQMWNAATVTLVSSLDVLQQRHITLQSAVPAPFARSFVQKEKNDLALAPPNISALTLTDATGQRIAKLDGLPLEDNPPGVAYLPAEVAELPSGGYVLARRFANSFNPQIVYIMTNERGEVIAPSRGISWSHLPTPDNIGYGVDPFGPKIAVTPSGRIGMVTLASSAFGDVAMFMLLDVSGEVLVPPTLFGAVKPWEPRGYSVRNLTGMVATADNHFMLVWQDIISGGASRLIGTVLNDDGSVLRNEYVIAEIQSTTYCCYGQGSFRLAASGQHIFLAGFRDTEIDYLVLDQSGQVTKPLTQLYSNPAIANNGGEQSLQMGRMADERAGVVWMESRGVYTDPLHAPIQQTLHFAVLDAVDAPVIAPAAVAQLRPRAFLDEPYGLMAFPDAVGQLVLLWFEFSSPVNLSYLNYEVLSTQGTVVTPPTLIEARELIEPHDFTQNFILSRATTHNAHPIDDANLSLRVPPQLSVSPNGLVTVPVRVMNSSLMTATEIVLTATLGADVTYISGIAGITPTITLSQDQSILVWHLPWIGRLSEWVHALVVRGPNIYGTRAPLRIEISASQKDAKWSDNAGQVDLWVSRPLYLPGVSRKPFY